MYVLRSYSSNLICRNILTLTNHFEISDQNITVDNYDQWIDHLNQTFPHDVSGLSLRVCDLQRFLDQVPLTSKTQHIIPKLHTFVLGP